MRNLFFSKHRDLVACTMRQNFQIALIYRLFRGISKKAKLPSEKPIPQWRDFLLVFLLHHAFPLFQMAYKLRGADHAISRLFKGLARILHSYAKF